MRRVLCVVLALGAFIGVFGTAYAYFNYADKDHTHSIAEIYQVLADGRYDKDYGLLEYTRRDVSELATSASPLAVIFLDSKDKILGENDSVGILCDKYVITRASLLDQKVAGIEDSSLVAKTRIFLLVNVPARGPDDFEELEGFYINLQNDYMVLERKGNPDGKFLLPFPEGCGFPVGNFNELSAGDALYQVGSFPVGRLDIDPALLSLTDSASSKFVFYGSPGPFDSGGPIFAIRDGHFELVGMNLGFFSVAPSKGLAISFATIVDEVKKVTGLNLLTGETENKSNEKP